MMDSYVRFAASALRGDSPRAKIYLFLVLFSFSGIFGFSAGGTSAGGGEKTLPIAADWAGYLKARGKASFQPAGSFYRAVGPENYLDGSLEGRLKNRLFWGSRVRLETHYEMVASGGDTQEARDDLAALFGGSVPEGVAPGGVPSDDRRLMDLTSVIKEEDGFVLYHRLDRLALTASPDWGTVTAGRQAVTWGNGFLFNPMDLFNPFSPTDIERDYKLGDDMLFVQVPAAGSGSVQMLYVPRRDPDDGDVTGDEASLALKGHLFKGSEEFDLMAAKHYQDYVFGLGGAGTVGDAAWRADVTWTHLAQDNPDRDYPSFVANIDYSWIWWKKNVYGFAEFFYSGVGKDDYQDALSDPTITARIARGELFTLGRSYFAGHLRIELHPLVNLLFTTITNVEDPSGVLQPRLTWDVTGDLQLLLGGNVVWGAKGSEYGGISIPGTPYTTRAADSVYGWLAYYF